MTRSRAILLTLAAAASVAGAGLLIGRPDAAGGIDLSVSPQTVYRTVPFNVGDTYTFGSTAVPTIVKRPVRLTSIKVLHATGVEILGLGALEPHGKGIGLVPGWPPPSPYVVQDPFADGPVWNEDVQALIGIRTTAPRSGFRGVELQWIDGDGRTGSRVFDYAVLTCSPGACTFSSDLAEPLLKELQLMR